MARELRVCGTAEAADLLGVHRVTVSKWTADQVLPPPDAVLASGPVWRTSTLEAWQRKRDRRRNDHRYVR